MWVRQKTLRFETSKILWKYIINQFGYFRQIIFWSKSLYTYSHKLNWLSFELAIYNCQLMFIKIWTLVNCMTCKDINFEYIVGNFVVSLPICRALPVWIGIPTRCWDLLKLCDSCLTRNIVPDHTIPFIDLFPASRVVSCTSTLFALVDVALGMLPGCNTMLDHVNDRYVAFHSSMVVKGYLAPSPEMKRYVAVFCLPWCPCNKVVLCPFVLEQEAIGWNKQY